MALSVLSVISKHTLQDCLPLPTSVLGTESPERDNETVAVLGITELSSNLSYLHIWSMKTGLYEKTFSMKTRL